MQKTKQSMTYVAAALAAATVFIGACKKDNDAPAGNNTPAPKETIASMSIMLENDVDSTVQYVGWSDLDGPGGEQPIFDAVALKQNVEYSASFRFENAAGKNITEEVIKPNGQNYKICLVGELGFTITATDKDANNKDLGLNQKFKVTQTGSASLSIILKDQSGVKNGDCTPGSVWFSCNLPLMGN